MLRRHTLAPVLYGGNFDSAPRMHIVTNFGQPNSPARRGNFEWLSLCSGLGHPFSGVAHTHACKMLLKAIWPAVRQCHDFIM